MIRRAVMAGCVSLILAAGCATGKDGRPVLKEYRLPGAASQMQRPIWLASLSGDELGGVLSPDGRRLLYAGDMEGNLDIWIKDLTSGMPRRITRHVAGDTQPAWSPGGRDLAFISMRHDVKGDLFLWREGKLRQLTGRKTADGHPAFAPGGGAIYFTAGPEGRTRIERLHIASGRRTPLTGWGADHPAPSPDGRHLAFTLFDQEGRGRIAIKRLGEEAPRLITGGDFHAGFPGFSPDGKRVVYARFDSIPPRGSLTGEPPATLWAVELHRALEASNPGAAEQLARPLTSGRRTALFPQLHKHGLVFTSRLGDSLDVGLLPAGGEVPNLGSPQAQLALALEQDHARDQLLCLERVVAKGRSVQASRALYLQAGLHRELGHGARAARLLETLVHESALTHGEYAQLAAIDLAVLPLKGKSLPAPSGLVDAALARLDRLDLPAAPQPRVAAHLLLRRGDAFRLGGRVTAALGAYETLLERHPGVAHEAVEASFRQGELLSLHGRQPHLLSRYFLDLMQAYPKERKWLRRAARAVLDLWHKPGQGGDELERLRALVEQNRGNPLFCALASMRMARILEKQGKLELAIEALHAVVSQVAGAGSVAEDAAQAAFELGRISLELSAKLRKSGKLSRALAFYDKALSAYEAIMKRYKPGHEHYIQARKVYLRLALLDAAQREREGEEALAEKRYRRILTMAPALFQAHRRIISMGVARGDREGLVQQYRARVEKDAADAVGNYGLGYLATLAPSLGEKDLKNAEGRLKRAISLSPRSPFGYMTLGWVYEMRERHLNQTHRGWLEEAIMLYERARGLNDRELNLQTEADLLVNLCSAFANLGNGWKQASRYCALRQGLKLPFRHQGREAIFHLTHGRAATALGRYELAARELEQALELARALGNAQLEAEVVSRLALTAHLQGKHEASNRYFARAEKHHRRLGQPELLAGLLRSMAYNLALEGKAADAQEMLARANQALSRHGTPAQEEISRIGSGGRTSAPFGFDDQDERYLALAIRGLNYREQQVWPEVAALLRRRVANRRKAVKEREDDELNRELGLLHNQLAVAELRLGQRGAFQRTMAAARGALAQSKEEAVQLDLQVALALNEAEELISARGASHALAGPVLQRLLQLESRRAAASTKSGEAVLSQRLRLGLWTNLALVQLAGGRLKKPAPARGRTHEQTVYQTLQELRSVTGPLRRAMTLLRRVVRETSTGEAGVQEEVDEVSLQSKGVLEPLYQPLGEVERLRWHVLAGLNLALVSASLTPVERLKDHPSTRLLKDLAKLCTAHELGELRYIVAAELAHRQRSLGAMDAAVKGLLSRTPPWLLDEGYSTRARTARRLVFGRAVDLALSLDKPLAALAFTEQRERRAFVDGLWRLPMGSKGRAAAPLKALLAAARVHREVLSQQAPGAAKDEAKIWRGKLEGSEQQVRTKMKVLASTSPRVAGLLWAGAFPLQQVMAALSPGEQLVTALEGGGRWMLIGLMPGVEPRVLMIKERAAEMADLARGERAALEEKLAPLLEQLTSGSARIYLDLGRINPLLRPERMLKGRQVVRLATLWELADANQVRTPPLPGGMVADPDPRRAKALAASLGLKALTGNELVPARLDLPLEHAGALIWSGPLRHDGGSPANMRLLLSDGKGRRLEDLRLVQALGMPLRGYLLVLLGRGSAELLPGRSARVAFCRLIHAMGVPTVALLQGKSAQAPAAAKMLGSLIESAAAEGLSQGASASGAAPGELQLLGHGGLDQGSARALAEKTLKKHVFAGAKAFNKRKLPEAVERLEQALGLIKYLGQEKYLDGSLLYLANSYTLLKDLRRAVPMAERLLGTRTEATKKARRALAKVKGTKGEKRARLSLMKAQVKRIKALMLMGWLRLRNEQYDLALKVNQQALDLYKEVGRPHLAGEALKQRTTIADKKGDYPEARANAREALKIAQSALGKARKKLKARLKVADAAALLARIERKRFSSFSEASAAIRISLQQLDLLPAKEQQKAVGRRLSALLEVSRIHSARGNYGKAVEEARKAREMARTAGAKGQDQALLEEVNNLFFLGAYGQALLASGQGIQLAGKNKLRRLQFLNAKGSVLANLGWGEEALKTLDRALALARELGNASEVAAGHNNLGNALRRQGRFAEALKEFTLALAIDSKQKDRLGMANDLANLGLAELLLGKADDARKTLVRARKLSRELGAPQGEFKALVGLGRLELLANKPREALKHLQGGLNLSGNRGLGNWRWRFHLLAARAYRALGSSAHARRELVAGISLVEALPPKLGRVPGAPDVEETERDLYDELIDLMAVAGDGSRALEMSERLRARSFVDLVSQSSGRLPLKEARDLAARIVAHQGELAAAQAARMRAKDAADQEMAAADEGMARKALTAAGQALSALNPWLTEMVMAAPPALSQLRALAAKLGGAQVASYYPTRKRLLIWLLDAGGVRMLTVKVSRARLRLQVARFRKALTSFHDVKPEARALHRLLLAPLSPHLRGERLLVVPAGALHLVPFAALHDGKTYEVTRRTISYLPSIASLGRFARGAAPESGSWLSFAWSGKGPRPLTFAAREAQSLAEQYPDTRVVSGTEATASRFLGEAGDAAKIHVATHGSFDERAPLRTSLALAGGDLSLLEVLGLRLKASLVVLSACETGRGHLDGAQGVIGLHHAFLAAGAHRVVSTLYRVSDLGSALLMKYFFRHLAAHPPARALREAQRKLLLRYPHPAFWSGFRLDGAP